MEPVGYLHNKMDVKILILFILSRIETPLGLEDIHEVAYQDDSLNYFTLVESLAELQQSGHLETDPLSRYSITEKGVSQGRFLEDSLAVPVVEKVTAAIARKNEQIRRDSLLTASAEQDEKGCWTAVLRYQDGDMPLMRLALMAPSREVGEAMAENMKQNIHVLYKAAMDCATGAPKKRSGGL